MLALKFANLDVYLKLMRADKPIGTYLVLWPALWALWFANHGTPNIGLLVVFCAGAFLVRSAGCVINDYADRNIDAKVERTKDRPLATDAVSEKEALQLFAVLMATAAVLLVFTNWHTVKVAIVVASLTTLYPFTKRFTNLPQFFLGLAFSSSVIMAYSASIESLPIEAWLMFIANACWTIAYDTYYAMVDREDDIKAGIKSIAIYFGENDLKAIGSLQVVFVSLMAILGLIQNFGLFYFLGLSAAVFMFIQQFNRCRKRDREACFKAFLNNNYVGMAVFVGLCLEFWR